MRKKYIAGNWKMHKTVAESVALADALGVSLPSNAPAVNSLWLPAPVLKIPVLLKPGREDPFTPFRIVQALLAAGGWQLGAGLHALDQAIRIF